MQSIKWNTPEDELNGLTKYLRQLLDGQEDAREANTCVVVPNRRWAVMVEKMLRRRGFNVSAAGAAGTLAGDPRDSTRSRALVAYTKLGLLADPTDMIAWRSWCGFDNALTNSDAWMGLQDFAEAEGLTLYQALQKVGSAGFGAKEPFLRARTLAEKWRSGQDFLEKNATRRGFGLMTVSYTHLDVYKRQGLYRSHRRESQRGTEITAQNPRKGVKFEPVFLQNNPEPGGRYLEGRRSLRQHRAARIAASRRDNRPEPEGAAPERCRNAVTGARRQSGGRAHCSLR